MDIVDRARLHQLRILTFAERRRDAWHHGRWDAPDVTSGRAVDVPAEYRNDTLRTLQGRTERGHRIQRVEMNTVWSDHNLERGMVREHSHGLCGVGVNHVDQSIDPLAAEVAAVARYAERIKRNQSDRKVVHRIVDEIGIGL
jgi:hypothetical protein